MFYMQYLNLIYLFFLHMTHTHAQTQLEFNTLNNIVCLKFMKNIYTPNRKHNIT